MIDMVDEHDCFDISPLIPALDEFEAELHKSLTGLDHSDLSQKLTIEASIYGELIQILDKHGLRTYGLATAVQKYYNYFLVNVIATEPAPQTIRQIKIPLT